MINSGVSSNQNRNHTLKYSVKSRERKTIRQLLMPGETLEIMTRGKYIGGKGLLIATNRRIILLDSKIMTEYTKTLKYERIKAVSHSKKVFESFLFLTVGSNRFVFRSHSKNALRKLAAH